MINENLASPFSTQTTKSRSKSRQAPQAEEVAEGRFTRMIETQTAKIQSVNWLAMAVACMGVSATAEIFFKRKAIGNFLGLWAPCFMLFGVYNKLVKIEAQLDKQAPRARRTASAV